MLVGGLGLTSGAQASIQVPQTALDGTTVPKYVTARPHFAGARIPAGITFNPQLGTYVWGYAVGGAPQYYPDYTVEAQKGTATSVTHTNNLGTATTFPILQRYITVDQTLNWANPLGRLANGPARFSPYSGPNRWCPICTAVRCGQTPTAARTNGEPPEAKGSSPPRRQPGG